MYSYKDICKVLIFSLLFAIYPLMADGITYAQINNDAFIISTNKNVLRLQEEFIVEIKSPKSGFNVSAFSKDRFRVKPQLDGGGIVVYNPLSPKNEGWISTTSTWSDMPPLQNSIRIKIASSKYFLAGLSVLVQDTLLGTMHRSNKILIYTNGDFISSYITRLNERILSY